MTWSENKILEYLIENGIKRETQKRTYEYQIDDIVEFCENTIHLPLIEVWFIFKIRNNTI